MWRFGRIVKGEESSKKKMEDVYRFRKDEVILRDMLAMDRTILANERTVLAWLRTSMSMVLGGVSFIEFLDVRALYYVGWFLIYSGLFIFVFGVVRYAVLKKQLYSMKHHS